MGPIDHLRASRKADDITTAASTLVEHVDEERISPSDGAARFEALNALGVDHPYFIGDAACSANGREEKSSQQEGE